MGTTEDWRSPTYGDQFEGFERPDFAQEFLRRNPEYVDDFERAGTNEKLLHQVAERWGLCIAFDPSQSANQSRAIWNEKLNPVSVEVHGPDLQLESIMQDHHGRGIRHILIEDVHGNHFIVWKKSGSDGYRIIIPITCETIIKLRAADRFHRHLSGKKSGPFPSPYRLTVQQKQRLVATLRMMDAKESGTSERTAAKILHDEEVSLSEWSDSSERAHVRRLLRRGHYLSDEGYRKLLNPYR